MDENEETSFDDGRLGDCFAVFSRIGGAVVYAGRKIAADGLSSAYRLGEAALKVDLVAALGERRADVSGKAIFHHHVATGERIFRESGSFQRGLNVHSEVRDVGYELRVRLRLVETAHDAEGDAFLAAGHKAGDDGV